MYNRIDIIDEFRGSAIVLMIIYHFLYQGVLWTSFDSKILDNQIIEIVRLGSEIIFIFIAGVSCSLSKNNYRRGLKCIYFGILITVITYLIIPKEVISFGILHFLGISMIFYELFRNRLKNINPIRGTIITLIFFVLTYLIFYENFYLNQLMKVHFINYLKNNGYLNLIGLKSSSFVSSDYFPIIPWTFLFFAGGFIGEKIKKVSKEDFSNNNLYLLKFLGRHSFFIYLSHIPIIIAILYLIKYVFLILS